MVASQEGRTEVVKLLLAAPGIDVHRANDHRKTPLWGASYRGRAEVLKLMLAVPGIQALQRDKEGKSAMDAANDSVVASLLEEDDSVVAAKRTFGALLLTFVHRGIFRDMAAHLATHDLADARAKAMAAHMRNTRPT